MASRPTPSFLTFLGVIAVRFGLVLVIAVAFAQTPGRVEAQLPPGLGQVTGEVVWVDFWASWCAPCRRSFPWMNQMLDRYGPEGLQIIGMNLDKERTLAQGFLDETPAKFDIRYDPEAKLAEEFGVQAMPSSFLLDSSGNVIATHYGFRLDDTEAYETDIINALARSGGQ